jgi:hypothetical protein
VKTTGTNPEGRAGSPLPAEERRARSDAPYLLTCCLFLLLFLALPASAQNGLYGPVIFNPVTNQLIYGCHYVNAYYNVTAYQLNCTNVSVVCTPPSGTAFAVGTTTTVTCVATGCGGQTATTNFTVTVAPSPMHIIGANNLLFYSCTNTTIFFSVLASSPCCVEGNEVVCTPASGFVMAPGTTTNVVCVGTDCNNSHVTNTFTVTVMRTAIQLSCSPSKTVPYNTNWSFDPPTVAPGCCADTNYTLTALPWVTNLSGAFYIIENWVVTNSCGESNSCYQVVTLDFSGSFGGVASADSGDFTLDTTGTLPGVGGVAQADSGDFTLDTTGTLPGVGGVAQADSLDFTLDTTGSLPGVGGVAQLDSLDFTLDTTGASGAFADSLDFILDTRGLVTRGPVPFRLMYPLALPGGAFRFSFTNGAGVSFSVYGVTNVALPLSNWAFLGALTDNPPGQFEFTDPQGSNYPQRFYRVSSP